MAKHPLLFSSAKPKPLCNKKFPKCRPRVYFDIRIGNKKNFGNYKYHRTSRNKCK